MPNATIAPAPVVWNESHRRNIAAMKAVEGIETNEEQIEPSDRRFAKLFRTTVWEHVQLFLLDHFPRFYMYFWGQKLADAIGHEDIDQSNESNKVVQKYLIERTRQARNNQKKDVTDFRARYSAVRPRQ